ncbi:MAG: 5'-nucleotidase C-terminal domain-containing protein [Deltaproteobacteria bacterium]|nr:5'-nucleotidase C-terminal domain-containing protein [Deltaproteobacteria bacterium]
MPPPRALPVLLALVAATPAAAVPVTVIATTDLHGRVGRTAALAGYLQVLRKQSTVVLIDAGDMFQGTLESNPNEGESVVTAYNALGYDAVAIGNHEFDFGPAGPRAVPHAPDDDPRGALKARAQQARFPFLAANIVDQATGKPVTWPNTHPAVLVEKKAGKGTIKVGIIGVSSFDTPKTTMASNFVGLKMSPLATAITREAEALRARGARLVLVAAHAGGKCERVDVPTDLSSCDSGEEVFELARALVPGTVDLIAAGHTHNQVAHVVSEIPVVQAWANGQGFSRVDFEVDLGKQAGKGRARLVKVHPPQRMCEGDADPCVIGRYHDHHVEADGALERTIAPWVQAAAAMKAKKIGVVAKGEVKRSYDDESLLGNLFADVILESSPGADVALMNGGGIRANLPGGELTYGHVFEAMPFDNRLAVIHTRGSDLRKWLQNKLSSKHGGFLSIAGVQVEVACNGSKAGVTMTRPNGRAITDDEPVAIATTDFLASGGEAFRLPDATTKVDEGELLRERLVTSFQRRKVLPAVDKGVFDAANPRFSAIDGKNPRCGIRGLAVR